MPISGGQSISYEWKYSIYNDPDYDTGDNYVIPGGHELVWYMADEALDLEMYDGAMWQRLECVEGLPYKTTIGRPLMLTSPLYCFGGAFIGSVRIESPATDNHILYVCTRRWEPV